MAARLRKILVWIYLKEENGNSFLLLRTTPERGEFWQPVTGSVEPDEEVEAAALREMSEETGLVPVSIRPVSRPYEFESRGETVTEFPFLAEAPADSREKIRLDRNEHTEFQWAGGDSALELLKYESNARVLRDALEEMK